MDSDAEEGRADAEAGRALVARLGARLDALERCTVVLLGRFDAAQSSMDRYYEGFLELEDVMTKLAENQRRLAAVLTGAGPGSAAPAAGSASKWRGKRCRHGRRGYRCRPCAAEAAAAEEAAAAAAGEAGEPGEEPVASAGAAGAPRPAGHSSTRADIHAQLAGDLRVLKQRLATAKRAE